MESWALLRLAAYFRRPILVAITISLFGILRFPQLKENLLGNLEFVSELQTSIDKVSSLWRNCESMAGNQGIGASSLRSTAVVLALRGNCLRSLRILNQIVDRHPNDTMSWLWLGDMSALLNKPREATTAWMQAEASALLVKRSEQADSVGDRISAQQWLVRAAEIETDPIRGVSLAIKLKASGLCDEATQILSRLKMTTSPSEPSYWLLEGTQAELNGDWEAATQSYSKGLLISPFDLVLLKNAKRAYERQQNWQQAYSTTGRIVELAGSGWWMLEQARYATKLGRFAEADALIVKASELNDQTDWKIFAARAKVSCAAGKSREAMSFFSRALAIEPGNWQLLYARGLCCSSLGDFDQSINDLQQAAELAPKSIRARGLLLDLARLLESKGRIEEAVAAYESLLSISPSDSVALGRLTRIAPDR